MADNSIRETGTFGLKIDGNSTGIINLLNVSSIVQQTLETLDPRWTAGVSFFLESLRLTVWLPSFLAAGYPETRTSDNAATKAIKLMEVEANYPKTGLRILRKHDDQAEWLPLATVTLQNRGREAQIPLVIPYLTINQLKILSRHDNLAIELVDFGDGVVGGGSILGSRPLDFLQIEGEWRMDVDVAYRGRRPTHKSQFSEDVVTISQVLLAAENRAYFEIQNTGKGVLLYGFSDDFLKFKLNPGELYHPASSNDYISQSGFWVRPESDSTTVSIVEWLYL